MHRQSPEIAKGIARRASSGVVRRAQLRRRACPCDWRIVLVWSDWRAQDLTFAVLT